VVNSLRLKLMPGRRRYDTNLEAWEMYLRGRHAMAGFPARGRQVGISAVRFFDQAIEKDARYAIAYAGKADALLAMDENTAFPGLYTQARDAAAMALSLDPMLSEAYSARGAIRARDYAWADADADLRRAIDLNPNNGLAHLRLGLALVLGPHRVEEGVREAARAASLDPLSPYVTTEFGRALLLAGRYAESAAQLQKSIALDKSRNRAFRLMARALSLQGKHAEAIAAFEDGRRSGGFPPDLLASPDMVCAYRHAGRRDEATAMAQQSIERGNRAARGIAHFYACIGDIERALDIFSQAIAANEPGLAEILRAPELAWLRSDPRAASLLLQLHLSS